MSRQAKHSATIVACPSGCLTADKRQNFILPKLLSATSFIHKPLGEAAGLIKRGHNGKSKGEFQN